MPCIGWNIPAPSLPLVLGFLRVVANLWHKKTEALRGMQELPLNHENHTCNIP